MNSMNLQTHPLNATPLVYAPEFNPEFRNFLANELPDFVKQRFSPDPRWVGKPFTAKDASFFAKGVVELSEIFTSERVGRSGRNERGLHDYFDHPKFRSSYFLYFLPLHAMKFFHLFDAYERKLAPFFLNSREDGKKVRIVDFGSGPGTASFALAYWLLFRFGRLGTKKILHAEFTFIDQNKKIMEDGAELFKKCFSQSAPFELKTEIGSFEMLRRKLADPTPTVYLFGNVLNELNARMFFDQMFQTTPQIPAKSAFLFVEPAARHGAQKLSDLRDLILAANTDHTQVDPTYPQQTKNFDVWGPCLHSGRCPLRDGRDYCNQSVPMGFQSKWFRYFSEQIGSERGWLKFAHFFMSAAGAANPEPKAKPEGSAHAPKAHTKAGPVSTLIKANNQSSELRRVLSDPLGERDRAFSLLLCAPETPERKTFSPLLWKSALLMPKNGETSRGPIPMRGDLVNVGGMKSVGAERTFHATQTTRREQAKPAPARPLATPKPTHAIGERAEKPKKNPGAPRKRGSRL